MADYRLPRKHGRWTLSERYIDDLEFFYRVRPSTAKQRARARRIAETLLGTEVALPAAMQNRLRFHEPLLSAAVAKKFVSAERARELDDYQKRGVDSAEERLEFGDLTGQAQWAISGELNLALSPDYNSLDDDDRPPRRKFVEVSIVTLAKLRKVDESTIRDWIASGYVASARRGYVRFDHRAIRRFHAWWNRGGGDLLSWHAIEAKLTEGALSDREIGGKMSNPAAPPSIPVNPNWKPESWVAELIGEQSLVAPGRLASTLSELRELSGLSTRALRDRLAARGIQLAERDGVPLAWLRTEDGQDFVREILDARKKSENSSNNK